ncbi:hypothetical protein BUALT_Bualt01G0008500 [Buddleja alternifolia]|uniref:Uncharacterized protein n=1 Tax=Buddleja alternifolia TaxID=168488 RepID=A0AAV6Y4M0_9LAMI|nr:hypothetical protein BUALT_Bualt01G0008500 [Buddleja alternifolia]
MAKSKKLQLKSSSQVHGVHLHKLSSRCRKVSRDAHHKEHRVKASEKKEWNNTVCSVCLEFPHKAVLLLCSSYDKGCRPYMCATSHRYSNCLDQYKKAYAKVTSNKNTQSLLVTNDDQEESRGTEGKFEKPELLCPLCRGQVKGWTVVKRARGYFNKKKRTCTQDNCSFVGTYKELRNHVKLVHPSARPRDVDPTHAEKWKKLENERDLSDVFSTIRSTMPGAIVIGDYVIERNFRGVPRDFGEGDDFFRFPMYGGRDSFDRDYDSLDDEEDLRRHRVRAAIASRNLGSNVTRIARPHARLLFARRLRR